MFVTTSTTQKQLSETRKQTEHIFGDGDSAEKADSGHPEGGDEAELGEGEEPAAKARGGAEVKGTKGKGKGKGKVNW